MKSVALPARVERRSIRFGDFKTLDLRLRRTVPTGFAERSDCGLGSGEDRFNIAVGAVSHPTGDTARFGLAPGKGAKADTLHAAGYPHADDFFCSFH